LQVIAVKDIQKPKNKKGMLEHDPHLNLSRKQKS